MEETKKQEAIRLAYGEHWKQVKDRVNESGWNETPCFNYNINSSVDYKSIAHGVFITRPKSLSGIENNNFWTCIESEADLPTESGRYFIFANGKVDVGTYILTYKVWKVSGGYYSDTHQNLNITHYQPITKPKPLIF